MFKFVPSGPYSPWPRAISSPMLPAMRIFPVGGAVFYGLPDKPNAPEVAERDRPGSRLTRPNATDTDVKLAQFVRVSGLVGFVMLPSRTYTANARPTRNVPSDVSGLPPAVTTDPLARVTYDHMLLSDPELRHLRKYRSAMKGEKFAESMAREQRERDLAYEREAFPYLPRNKAGRVLAHYQTATGTVFSDGTTLRERVESWKAHNAEHVEDMRERSASLSRKAELAALVAAHLEDDAETKRNSRKVRERNIAVTALRFK